MKISLSFDIEPDIHTGKFIGITEGLSKIIKILDKYNIKSTFFVTCDVLNKFPEIFQDLKKQGHEIALHGFYHTRFDSLSQKQKELQIQKSILCFQKYLHITPKGFRAPQHSIDKETLDLLEKYDFKYDSSLTPFNLLQILFFPTKIKHWKYFFYKLKKHKIRKNIYELPISSFFLPFVSLSFRALNSFFFKVYFSLLKIFNKELIFYAHSWDFIDSKGKISKMFPKEKLIKNLDSFLSTKGNKFSKLIDLI
tara:strand:- start:377 stop:1132 length:756 start_codon:yes stop_codon:yes gene_type:complete